MESTTVCTIPLVATMHRAGDASCPGDTASPPYQRRDAEAAPWSMRRTPQRDPVTTFRSTTARTVPLRLALGREVPCSAPCEEVCQSLDERDVALRVDRVLIAGSRTADSASSNRLRAETNFGEFASADGGGDWIMLSDRKAPLVHRTSRV